MGDYIYTCLTVAIAFICIILALDKSSEVVTMTNTSNKSNKITKSFISSSDKFIILLQIAILIALGFFYSEYKTYKATIVSLTEQYMNYVKEIEDIKAKVDNFKETLTLYDKNIKEKCELLQNVPINERTVINAMESVRKEMKNVKDK